MKTWEYEALRDVRNAIAKTVVDECVRVLRESVNIAGANLIEAHFANQNNAKMIRHEAACPRRPV